MDRTILIIDDTPAVREDLYSHVVAAGYHAVVAESGEAGLRLFRQHRPDLVLLDLVMPSIDGYATAKLIKAQCHSFLTIIMMTARTDRETQRRSYLAGGDDFLIKPVNAEDLVMRIAAQLRVKDLSEQLEKANSKLETELNEIRNAEGLTLYFYTHLTSIDRFLVDGVIFGVLGTATDCRVVEYRQGKDNAIVRLRATKREDLEKVAEALYSRVWEHYEHAQEQALVMAAALFGPREMLSELRSRLDHLELRLEKEQAWSWDLGPDRLQLPNPVHLFLSYAREDEHLHHQMDRHLGALRRQGIIKSWHTGDIEAGQKMTTATRHALDAADVIVVLVSADLIGADASFAVLQCALARHAACQARLIPVLVRPVDLAGTPLERLQALPEGGRPVTSWSNIDEAWVSVASGIRRTVMGMSSSSKTQ